MTTWTTFPIAKTCGSCGRRVSAGEAMQIIRIDGLRRPLLRCAGCADVASVGDERHS
jgi:hypothetical protein